MTARADDRVLWLAREHQHTLHAGLLYHVCPHAIVGSWQSREQLDPMALGTCRYCGERLPVPPDKETDQSSALSS